jgi:hypothetical protein
MTIYEIKNSPTSITSLSSGNMLRKKINFFLMQTTDGVTVPYAAFLVIEESVDKSVYTIKYTSSSVETRHEYSPSSGIAAVRVAAYDDITKMPLVAKVINVEKKNVSGYKSAVTAMPENPDIGDIVLWSGTTDTYIDGRLYEWDGVGWNKLDYTTSMGAYTDALTDILASHTTSTGYFDAAFCNAFFANSASINALQTKTITLKSGGELLSDDYVKNESGIRVGYEGDADFNNNLHIGGNATIDGTTHISGTTTIDGTTHIGGNATIDGTTHIGGSALIEGVLTVSSGEIKSSNYTVGGEGFRLYQGILYAIGAHLQTLNLAGGVEGTDITFTSTIGLRSGVLLSNEIQKTFVYSDFGTSQHLTAIYNSIFALLTSTAASEFTIPILPLTGSLTVEVLSVWYNVTLSYATTDGTYVYLFGMQATTDGSRLKIRLSNGDIYVALNEVDTFYVGTAAGCTFCII